MRSLPLLVSGAAGLLSLPVGFAGRLGPTVRPIEPAAVVCTRADAMSVFEIICEYHETARVDID